MPKPRINHPLYRQVREQLERDIAEGVYAVGSQLPAERDLCVRFGVSHITIRRALGELAGSGLVYKHGGRGSFVARQKRQLRILLCMYGYEGESWRKTGGAFSLLIGGAGHVAWENDAILSILHISGPSSLAAITTIAEEAAFDGLILRPKKDIGRDVLSVLSASQLPHVIVRRYHPDVETNYVISNDRTLAADATNHLLSLGHQDIAVLAGTPDVAIFRDRLGGFRNAYKAAGLIPNEKLIIHSGDFQESDGYQAMKRLLEQQPGVRAVFITGSLLTLGAYRCLREQGISVPDRVAIVGWDDMDIGHVLFPALTAITTPHYEFGRTACNLLIDVLEKRRLPGTKATVPGELVVRQSCGYSHSAGIIDVVAVGSEP